MQVVKNISSKTAKFISNNINEASIEKSNLNRYDIYQIYNRQIAIAITIILSLSASFVITSVVGETENLLSFVIGVLAVRSFLGGFHFDDSTKCFIFTIIYISIGTFISNQFEFGLSILSIALLIYGLSVVFIGVVDHENRPSDENKKKMLKLRSVSIVAVLVPISVLANCFGVSVNGLYVGITLSCCNLAYTYLKRSFSGKG